MREILVRKFQTPGQCDSNESTARKSASVVSLVANYRFQRRLLLTMSMTMITRTTNSVLPRLSPLNYSALEAGEAMHPRH